MSDVGYIAYIDEAGDDGTRLLRTRTSRGATEWMAISAVLIKANREHEVLTWVKDIIDTLEQKQIKQLHYYKLDDHKKILVCSKLAALNIRIFTVISRKTNIEGYRNLRAEKAKINKTAWFYCWMTRLLLERVSKYCGRRSLRDYGMSKSIRFEFSDRGGVRIEDIRAYYDYLRVQSGMSMMHLSQFDLDWSVIDTRHMYSYPNAMRAGLQLADSAASAFFGGLEFTDEGKTKPEPAKLLLPRICSDKNNKRYGFGLKLMPVWIPNLPPEQADLINFYMHK